jgi:hypothetical protein
MIRLFIAWARTYLGAAPDDFTIKLHLHSGQSEQERIAFRSAQTGIAPSTFGKTYIKPEGTGHRKNILYNGTATIRLRRSSDALRRVLGWIDGYSRLRSLR